MKEVAISEFRAKCCEIIEQVRKTRKPIRITRFGEPAVSCFGISEAPHGGVKASGIGRTHGRWGLEEMVRIKYIDSDRLPRMKKSWWYSYGAGFAEQIEGFLDFQFANGLSNRVRGALRSRGLYTRKGRI